MKTDITPYTEEEARRFGDVLFKLQVPCFGPATGLELLKIVEGLDRLIKDPRMDQSMTTLLQGYRHRLTDICAINAQQQGSTIEAMERFIKST